MKYAYFLLSNGSWNGIEHDTADDVDETTHGVRPIPFDWQQLYFWSAQKRGFFPKSVSTMRKSKLEYQLLFTLEERIAIRTSSDPIVIDSREMAQIAEFIDLTDPNTIAGTQYLQMAGILTAERVEQVLAGSPPA